MPDFAANAIGFYLQVADQATPILAKAEARYTALTRAMEANAKAAGRTSSKTSSGMALLAGSLDAVSDRMRKTSKGLGAWGLTQAATGKGARRMADTLRLKAVYPRGRTDPHYSRAGMMQAYRQETPAPDYILKIPAMQEGGVAMTDMLARIGEAGPEAVIPLDKLMSVLPQVAEKQKTEWLKTGFKLSIDNAGEGQLLTFLGQLEEGTNRWNEMGDAERAMFKQLIKDSKTASAVVQTGMVDVLEGMEDKIKNIEKAMGASTRGVAASLGDLKDAITSAVFSGQTLTAALGVASFTMAAQFEKGMYEARSQMRMTDAEFTHLSDTASSAMSKFGLSMEQTTAIARGATYYKFTGPELEQFINTTAKASQAFEALGMSVDETMDLLVNGIKKLRVNMEDETEILSAMAGAAQYGTSTLDELSTIVKSNSNLFMEITARGGDAKQAIIGLTAVVSELSSGWIEEGEVLQFVNDVMDRAKWTEMGPILGQIGYATGKSATELEAMAAAGDTAGVMIDYVKGALSVTDEQIRMYGSHLQEATGYTREQVRAIQAQYASMGDSEEAIRAAIAASEEAAKNNQAMEDQWKSLQSTFLEVVDRIKNILIPVLASIGQPLLEVVSMVLMPFVSALRWAVDAFKMLPGPIKKVLGFIVGLGMALAVYNTVMSLGVIQTAAMAVVQSVYSAATQLASAATWLFNAALYANPIGLIVLGIVAAVAALGLLVYGFMEGAAWAKTLGIALLFMLGPFTAAIGMAALLYDTLFGGGDVIDYVANIFETVVGYIEGAVDWLLLQAETLPNKLVSFIESIPAMIASVFEGGGAESKVGAALWKMFSAGFRLVVALFVKLPIALLKLVGNGFIAAGKLIFDAVTWPYRKAWEYITSLFDFSGLLGGLVGIAKAAVAGFLNAVLITPLNAMVDLINAALAYVPNALLPEELAGGMSRFAPIALAEGGIATRPTVGLIGERGPEAVLPLTALGEFMDTAGAGVAGRGEREAPPNVEVNLDQTRVEELLTEILAVLSARGGGRTGGGGGVMDPFLKKLAFWEV